MNARHHDHRVNACDERGTRTLVVERGVAFKPRHCTDLLDPAKLGLASQWHSVLPKQRDCIVNRLGTLDF